MSYIKISTTIPGAHETTHNKSFDRIEFAGWRNPCKNSIHKLQGLLYTPAYGIWWDDEKAAINLADHNVSFDEARTVFNDPLYIDFYDPDHSYDEHRYLIIGESQQRRLLIVSYTERGNLTRLISAREATPAERRDYEKG